VRSKVVKRETFERLVGALGARWKPLVEVLAGSGWHTSELERFARHGTILPFAGQDGAAVLVTPQHKHGAPHSTIVSEACARAARRVLELGPFSRSVFEARVREASAAIGVYVRPGHFRHTTASFAVEQGANIGSVSDFLGHQSQRTTKRFYATHAVPRKVPTLL
jgi:integrase